MRGNSCFIFVLKCLLGQHLITAIADKLYNYKTTSWNLGEKVSFIELDTENVTSEQLEEIQNVSNEKIREYLPVHVKIYDEGSPELQEVSRLN